MRQILIFGEISADSCGFAYDQILEAEHEGEEAVELHIASGGGDLTYSWGLIDLIRRTPLKVTGIATGCVASAAVDILVACDERLATPNAIFMVHAASSSAAAYARMERTASEHLWSGQTGMSRDAFAKMFRRRDRYFGVNEALDLNIIHGLLEP